MTSVKKSWVEKLKGPKDLPKVLSFQPNFPCSRALQKVGAKEGDSVVISTPMDVYEIMKKVSDGRLITLDQISEIIAKKYRVKFCCTLTTGIFITISANASKEMGDLVPFWRTIKNDGALNEKYPGGILYQKDKLEREGFEIVRKGSKYFVKDFEKYLVKPEEMDV